MAVNLDKVITLILDGQEAGKTNSEMAAELSTLTLGSLSIADIENFFSDNLLAIRNPINGTWEGPLVTVIEAGGPLSDGLGELFSHINKSNSTRVETNLLLWSVKAENLLAGLQADGTITADQRTAWNEIPGGERIFAGATEADVASALSRHTALEAEKAAALAEAQLEEARRQNRINYDSRFNTLFNTYLAALFAQEVVTDGEIVGALQQVVDNWVE